MNNSHYSIELSDARLPVIIRRHPSSRRIIVRYQPLQTCVSVTLPRYVTIRQGLDFVHSKRNWIENQVKSHPARIPFADGQVIPLLGRDYTLKHVGGRGVVQVTEGEILVHGEVEFLERRFRQWLVERARAEITPRARKMAAELGARCGKITVRDNSSSWGSCSPKGDLSFSWRLMFADPQILDYLICHEVAHLIELNHGPKFWALVARLCPNWQESRNWLRDKANQLYAYG